eukprot:1157177-Pelagomonas_calceolata.AAC.7
MGLRGLPKQLTTCKLLRFCVTYTDFWSPLIPTSSSEKYKEPSLSLPLLPPALLYYLPHCCPCPCPFLPRRELELLLPDVCVMQAHADTLLPESLDGEQLNPHYPWGQVPGLKTGFWALYRQGGEEVQWPQQSFLGGQSRRVPRPLAALLNARRHPLQGLGKTNSFQGV